MNYILIWVVQNPMRDGQIYWDSTNKTKLKGLVWDRKGTNSHLILRAKTQVPGWAYAVLQ